MAESKEKPVILDKAEQRIKDYLDDFAAKDSLFKAKYKSDNESIHKCRIYIEEQVRKVQRMMWDDDEIFGMAIHYFEEGLSPKSNSSSVSIATSGCTPEEIQKEIDKLSEKKKEELIRRAEVEFMNEQKRKLAVASKSTSKEKKPVPKESKPQSEPKKVAKPKKAEPMMLDLFAGID